MNANGRPKYYLSDYDSTKVFFIYSKLYFVSDLITPITSFSSLTSSLSLSDSIWISGDIISEAFSYAYGGLVYSEICLRSL